MRRRWLTIALPAVLAAALVAVSAYAYSLYRQRNALALALESERQLAFADMVNHVENIQTLLSKGLVSSSPRQSIVTLSEVWRHANAANADFGQLPVTEGPLVNTGKFLTQVGDFSYSLAKKNARGMPISDGDWNQLRGLQDNAASLSTELHNLYPGVRSASFRWVDPRRPAAFPANRAANTPVGDSFTRIDKRMHEIPTLQYDGPFSDHVQQAQPRGLTGGKISVDEARARALSFAGVRPEDYDATGGDLKNNAKIPSYGFRLVPKGGRPGSIALDVSQQGGQVVWMLNSRPVDATRLTPDQARDRAAAFLADKGYPSMASIYSFRADNTAVIQFAYKQDGVIIYPDVIKVKVALDNGEIIGLEAINYLMAHRERALPAPMVPVEQARAGLNPRVEVLSQRPALIPLENLEEVLTHEFRVKLGGTTYLIYVNALTGEEEKILQIIDTPEGAFTM